VRKWGLIAAAAAAVAVLAIAIVGSAAQAQTPPDGRGPSQRGQQFMQSLAEKLGVTVEQLRSATRETRNQLIDQAVAAGRLTREEGEWLKSGPGRGAGQQGPMRGMSGMRGMGGMGGVFSMSRIQTILAGSLGISEDALRAKLREGKSLAEIGAESGRTPEMLKNTLVTQMRADMQAQVTAGRLSQRAADRIIAGLDRMLLRIINAKPGERMQRQQSGPQAPGGPHGRGR
jgi:hypothetical protein